MKRLYILILFIIFSNCEKKEFINNFKYDEFGYSQRKFVLENNIKEILYYDVHFDLKDNPLWEKVTNKKVFDKNGNLIYNINPVYFTRELEEANMPEFSENTSIDNRWYYILNLTKSNISTGRVDTIFYEYDVNNNLILEKDKYFTSKYKNDLYGNEIERVFIPNIGETVINYKIYNYLDNTGKINYIVDSIPNSSVHEKRSLKVIDSMNKKKIYYKYDNLGRIVFNEKGHRKYDEQGRVVEVKDGRPYYKVIVDYDNKGDISSKTFIRMNNSSITKNDKTVHFKRIDTPSVEHYIYNDKGLPIQIKNVNKKGQLRGLTKIEYSFYDNN